ncbi:7932_t:CDS:2 [Funneliformis caledonium]|uniref:7932_t:CDS:1 n=1 Tax=Funneliformis caledonium TaxID=1117310 RepID=A0A9N8ZHG5_9GLOM|nr:7932_t:CDS:2 [Funneliformis caledonium]
MANKLQTAEDYEKSLFELDAELDNIQKCAEEIFHKIDSSFSYPYPIAELNVLLSAIQHFEKKSKNLGISSLTTTDIKVPFNEPGRSTAELYQESKRITDNAKAALSG